jgi:hypothetical protein
MGFFTPSTFTRPEKRRRRPSISEALMRILPSLWILDPKPALYRGSFSNSSDRSYDGPYGTSASGQQGIGLLENPFEGFDVGSVTFLIHGFGADAAVNEE